MRIGIVRTTASPCQCAQSVIKGLEALGHEFVLIDSEEIGFRALGLARECDLVIDHTDTFRGHGLFRPLVRLMLETEGARIVGSDARACFLADDKHVAKARLAEAGIATPPGILFRSQGQNIPSWLAPPLVLKPAFEHMSRGLRLAESVEQAQSLAAELLDRLQQPLLVETYIAGRELAVCLLQGPQGLEVLPALEWRRAEKGFGMLTEDFKLQDAAEDRGDACRSDLPVRMRTELDDLARRAFQAPGRTIFFLEANTTPSLEPLEALALSATWAGLDYPGLVDRMLAAALSRYGNPRREEEHNIRIDLPTGPVDLRVPENVHVPPPSSIDLARMLDVKAGDSVLDLGCGTGLLSIAAAKLGAGRVVATDVDPHALDAAARNARANGVDKHIDVRAGSWYDALHRADAAGRGERFEVIMATPPQTPGHYPFGPRYGGRDGTRHLFAVIEGARDFLEPLSGRLWLLAISLANPAALLARLREHFLEVAVVKETDRLFTAEEYHGIDHGLLAHFFSLRASGQSEFKEAGNGHYVFRNLFIRAAGVRKR
jgi:methylase of polypeptide subunit release factors